MAQEEKTSTYTVNMPHQAVWIVYINGIEVPVNSVNVDFGVWTIPTAQIRLIPHVLLQRIGHEDRLQVEIYYLDEFFDPAKPTMCLLGEYEVVGWTYQTTSAGRFLQLDCRSPLKILEQLRFYYMSSLTDQAKGLSAPTSTSGDVFSTTSVAYPLSLFHQGLVPNTKDPQQFITSPFEFIKNLLKALTDPIDLKSESDTVSEDGTLPRTASGVAGRNFFGRWIEMTDFRRRWAALPYFDDEGAKTIEGCFPIIKAVNSKEVIEVIAQQIGNSVGDVGTAWDLLQKVYGTMFMEIIAIPAPPAVQLTAKTNLVESRFVRRGGGKEDANYGGLLSYMVKPQCIFGIPPACNVIFPSMIRSYATSENYEYQPTRVYLSESYVSSLVSSQASGAMQQLAGELLVKGYPSVVQERMDEYKTNTNLNTRNFLIYPEELYKGPVSKHMNAPPWLYMLEKLGQKSVAQSAVKVGGKTYAKGKGVVNTIQRAAPAYGTHIKEAARIFGFPEDFIWGIIGRESEFNPNALGRDKTGSGGLMQMLQGVFVDSYALARRKKPNLPKLGNHGPGKQERWPDGKVRAKFKDSIYADMFRADLNIYAGTAKLAAINEATGREKGKLPYGAKYSDFSLESMNPTNPVPSLGQCVALAYNAGEKWGDKLLRQRKKYFSLPESQRDLNIFETDWNWKGRGAHWRVYSGGVYRFQKAFLAYQKMKKPGDTADAPSSPMASAQGVLPGDDQSKTYSVPGSDQQEEIKPATVFDTTDSENSLGDLFKLYAKYEYYRSRFETRTASVTLAFNPYIIPGFSGAILDNRLSGFHTIGYVNSVSHSFSAQGELQTNAVFSYVRTMPEYLKLIITGSNDQDLSNDELSKTDVIDLTVGPTEVIQEVANVFQVHTVVEDFYQKVFYADIAKGTPLSFDVDKYLAFKDLDGNPIVVAQNTPESPNAWTPDKGLVSEPVKDFQSYFASYDAAMTFCSRPVATLQQTIELRHGKPLAELLKDKKSEVQGPIDTYTAGNKSARFYSRIYGLMQPGGGPINTAILQAITNVGDGDKSLPEGSWQVITASHGIPQSRRNWDDVLIRYRNIVRGNAGAAQE